jgi:hypothetical protein
LKTQAQQQCKGLRDHTQGKVPGAVAKVVDYLKKG